MSRLLKWSPVLALFVCAPTHALSQGYATFYEILSEMYQEGDIGPWEIRIESHPDRVTLIGCSVFWISNMSNAIEIGLQATAFQTMVMRKVLTENGFPPSQWAGLVDQYQSESINLVYQTDPDDNAELALLQRVVSDLAATLGTSPTNGKYISTEVDGECGDGGVWALVETDPPGGRVWIIPEFDFRLCEIEGETNPWNVDGCGWWEVPADDISILSGTYLVVASWGDGSEPVRTRRKFIDEVDWQVGLLTVRR